VKIVKKVIQMLLQILCFLCFMQAYRDIADVCY